MKNMNWMLVGGLVIVAVLVYFFAMNKNPSVETMEKSTIMEQEQPSSEISTVVLTEQNESGETGSVTLTEDENGVTVVFTMTGAPQTAQPAHIHAGSCPTPGDVVHPLTDVVDGMSETVIDTTLEELRSQMPLAINVHQSAAAMKEYVACGDLVL